MLEHSASIAKLAEALNKAQTQMEKAKKDSNNPFFKSKYADLSAVWEACKDAILNNGFCVMQPLAGSDAKGNTLIVTMLIHTSGEWVKGVLSMPIAKPVKNKDDSISYVVDPQTVGSAITYGRRYSLAAMLNVMLEDDDAEGAMGRREQQQADKFMKKSDSPSKSIGDGKATAKQLSYLKKLIEDGKVSNETLKKFLSEKHVEKISDLPGAVISQLIKGAVEA